MPLFPVESWLETHEVSTATMTVKAASADISLAEAVATAYSITNINSFLMDRA